MNGPCVHGLHPHKAQLCPDGMIEEKTAEISVKVTTTRIATSLVQAF
jgi:hypothetical protein